MTKKEVKKENKVEEKDSIKEVKDGKKVEKKIEHKIEHKAEHRAENKEELPKKKSSKYRKLIEKYRRRNRLVEVIIACVILVIIFILGCNQTFLKTNYTKKVGNSTISIDIPLFTYYVSSGEDTIVFKTLRKSTNTREFFNKFLESETFDIYYCGDSTTPYYYSNTGKYFIYDIEVEKKFVVKTITVNYTTVDKDAFCSTIEQSEEEL